MAALCSLLRKCETFTINTDFFIPISLADVMGINIILNL